MQTKEEKGYGGGGIRESDRPTASTSRGRARCPTERSRFRSTAGVEQASGSLSEHRGRVAGSRIRWIRWIRWIRSSGPSGSSGWIGLSGSSGAGRHKGSGEAQDRPAPVRPGARAEPAGRSVQLLERSRLADAIRRECRGTPVRGPAGFSRQARPPSKARQPAGPWASPSWSS